MIPRYGPVPALTTRYTRRPGAYALLVRGSEALLTFQSRPWPEFQLPGGGIDPGEHPVPALHREVLEETGYRIASPRHLGTFRRFVYMPEYGIHAEKICHIYTARPTTQAAPPSEPDHTAHWVPLTVLLDYLDNDGDRAFLARRL